VVSRLLEYEAIVREISSKDNYAFVEAARKGHIAIVKLLLNCPFKIEKIAYSSYVKYIADAINLAISNADSDLLERILNIPNVVDEDTLCWAAERGFKNLTNDLLKFPIIADNIGKFGKAAISSAAQNGHIGIIERFLEFSEVRDNIDTWPDSALRSVTKRYSRILEARHIHFVYDLLNSGIIDNTALTEQDFSDAAKLGDLDIVNTLLEFPNIVEEISVNDNNALRLAVKEGHTAVVSRLLAQLPSGQFEFPAVVGKIASNNNALLNLANFASSLATKFCHPCVPEVERNPCTIVLSLMVIGKPCNAPTC
jgi:ankyrin repeat protein